MRTFRSRHRNLANCAGVVAISCLFTGSAFAQADRITKAIDISDRIVLNGRMPLRATAENDQGRVAPSMPMSYITLMLAKSPGQQAELDNLLSDLQDPNSPIYHQWLTPEEYGQRFGVSDRDLGKITAWLQGQGLKIAAVARGRNWVAVNGDASRIETAFRTEIHQYLVKGDRHFANSTQPSVPAALAGVVAGIRGLNDFRMKPANLKLKEPSLSNEQPRATSVSGEHFLAPGDVATIYDITPLYASGIDGYGQSLVIAGQTNINIADIRTFRSNFNLPANDPQLVLVAGSTDPGISSGDLDEADLDIEWSGAVARNAKIIFVYSTDVLVSTQYAIDQNLAPVISQSYGLCEPETGRFDAVSFRGLAQQANAEGITWMAASGDSGGADCDDQQNPGLSVDLPAAVPEVTALGGTEFAEGSGTYWNTTNTNGASALSYIPETSWNDSNEDGSPSASGGGASIFFTKPAWQTGAGVPSDNKRDVPDVSLSSSADHDGYYVYTSGRLRVYGGTSVAAPSFAGIATLLNHYLVSGGVQAKPGLGNMNVKLYQLAQSSPGAFHDITSGDNIVTVSCSGPAATCQNSAVGFHAGKGYDQVTGLGSVDVNKFVTTWETGTSLVPTSTSMTLISNARTVDSNGTVYLIASVTGANGVTPTGSVQFSAGGVSLGTATLVGSGGVATATLAVSGSALPQSSETITAEYSQGSSTTVNASVTVSTGSVSTATPTVLAVANGASFQHTYAPGMVLSVFGTQLAPQTEAASAVPLPLSMQGVAATINGVAAPLYFVSSQQLNIQVPYTTALNTPVTLNVNNNGSITTFQFTLSAEAPGIFTASGGTIVPSGAGTRGKSATLFLTGAGTVNPEVATGAAPAVGTLLSNLPTPAQKLTVTVGGIPATTSFVGIPWGLVGTVQVNFQIPPSVGTGVQPVVVSVGGVQSASASVNVTN